MKASMDLRSKSEEDLMHLWILVSLISSEKKILSSPERIHGGPISIMHVPITLAGESIIFSHLDESPRALLMRQSILMLWVRITVLWVSLLVKKSKRKKKNGGFFIYEYNSRNSLLLIRYCLCSLSSLSVKILISFAQR